MDRKLIQNNLAEATTEMGFPADVNFPLQREVELEDGTAVIVEGVTPDKMRTILNQNIESEEDSITFKTPGENYVVDNEVKIKGVCQEWNDNPPAPVEQQVIEVGKAYNLAFKSAELNKTTLDAYNCNGDITKILAVNLDESENELCRIGVTLDDSSEFPTVSTAWETDMGPCKAYIYPDMYEAIKNKVVTEADHSVIDTTSYTGDGWYNVTMVEGDLMDVSTIKITISKLDTIPSFSSLKINTINNVMEDDPRESLDLSGLFDTFEEADVISSIAVTTPPTKVSYIEGEKFNPAGIVVTGTYTSGKTEVIDNSELTFDPDVNTDLTAEDTTITISYNNLTCTQEITI